MIAFGGECVSLNGHVVPAAFKGARVDVMQLILLSQKAAGNRDQNQLLGEVHTSADGG